MKRLLIIFFLLSVFLGAYELGTDTWNVYTVFDPGQRTKGMTYPASWLKPHPFLLNPVYEDSSKTYGSWDQMLAFGGSGMSNVILAQYIPYSFPQRWSLGMNFVSYKGPNPTDRSDAVFDYRHRSGSVKAYHTAHTQTINLISGGTDHRIRANALIFDQQLSKKLTLRGGIDLQIIKQQEAAVDTLRHYNAHHEFIELNYAFLPSLQVYGIFEHRYFLNDNRQNIMVAFRPGLRYRKGIFMTHLAMRISPEKVFPIAQFFLYPKPFFVEVFAKVRNPIFILKQPGYQYYGVRSGIDHRGKVNHIKAEFEFTYDRTGILNAVPGAPVYIPPNFYMMDFSGEYRLNLKTVQFYLSGYYHDNFDLTHYFYHPEKGAVTGGITFNSRLSDGNLLLDGDISASYFLHDDPDSVSFDPVTLRYAVQPGAQTVGNWKIRMSLKARIKTFSITAEVSAPLNTGQSFDWHFYEGIYPSSDMFTGNTFYAGLRLTWLWWK